MMSAEFVRAIEQKTGLTIQQLQDTPIDVRRKQIEAQYGTPMKVLGSDTSASHSVIEKQLTKDLR